MDVEVMADPRRSSAASDVRAAQRAHMEGVYGVVNRADAVFEELKRMRRAG